MRGGDGANRRETEVKHKHMFLYIGTHENVQPNPLLLNIRKKRDKERQEKEMYVRVMGRSARGGNVPSETDTRRGDGRR